MKRWLSGLLAVLMLFSLTGCGGVVDLTDVPSDSQSTRLEEEKADLPIVDPEDTEEPEDAEDPENVEDPEVPLDKGPEDLLSGMADPDTPELIEGNASEDKRATEDGALPENGTYTTKDDVALYIYTYGHLPDNFITKKEAENLGWPGGNLEPYAPGKCIGGSRFGNYEGLLPEAKGRTYTECDIDTLGARSRGAKRIVFSNDGLIYYTGDHYKTFELLYGDESDG